MSEVQYIDQSPHHYRTEIPNIIFDMNLDPYEIALYTHIKRIAGDSGQSWMSDTKLSKKVKMCKNKMKQVRQSLEAKGLLIVKKRKKPDGSWDSPIIWITDIWIMNYKHFKKSSSMSSDNRGVCSDTTEGMASGDNKEELIKKKHIKKSGTKAPAPPKKIQIRKNVNITQKQLDSLKAKYSEEELELMFDKLSKYKEVKGKEYSSDMYALSGWVADWLKDQHSQANALEKLKEKNSRAASEIYAHLERTGQRGRPKILHDGFEDELLNKKYSFDKPNFPQVICGWYGLEWEEENDN